MPYIGTQPNDVKKNTGLYTPSEILQLEKDGHWGGSLELIESTSFADVSVQQFETLKENQYDVHYVTFSITKSSNRVYMQLREAGTYETSAVYQWAYTSLYTSNSENQSRNTSNNGMKIAATSTNHMNEGQSSGYFYLYNAGDSTKFTNQTLHAYSISNNTPVHIVEMGGATLPQTSVVDGFQFIMDSGSDITGTVSIYGLKQL